MYTPVYGIDKIYSSTDFNFIIFQILPYLIVVKLCKYYTILYVKKYDVNLNKNNSDLILYVETST